MMRDETLRKTPVQTLVSCIMPTYNRREFVPNAIRYFLLQDYEPKELIIIDDGTDVIEDLVPADERIRYYRLDKKITLGAKLNMACQYAKGTVIANWDDDDWYAARRLTYQVETLLREGTDICGINKLLYYDIRKNRAYQYIYPANQHPWLLGSTQCYTKQHWNGCRFADINVGMDGLFVRATRPDRITVLQDSTFSVFMIHPHNVSPKKTEGAWWHPYPVEEIRKILDSDWSFYRPEPGKNPLLSSAAITVSKTGDNKKNDKVETPAKPVRNVFACLVHESQECVVDLVRNLDYHDPSSQILLYNGSKDSSLLNNHFPFEKYGAVVHPSPRPMKWGWLHDFALDCMKYSIENFSFDILTIVDSDQLCVKRNYSHYMAKHLNPGDNIGMFGITEEQQTCHTKVDPAITAFKEIELWKPFLQRFPNGIDKFLYWSFWPSTVFTKAAATDLVKLFDEDQQLKEILQKTKIWASEEIILPTLVSLLGYKVKRNPCSYDYVKYRARYSLNDIKSALNKPDAFWVHPVDRKADNQLRKYIAGHFDNYIRAPRYEGEKNMNSSCDNPGYIFVLPIIRQIKNVEGWLHDDEAELLIHAAYDVLKNKAKNTAVVEIGSYCGKASIVLGNIIKKLGNPCSCLYAVDLFDGKVGAADSGIRQMPPTYEKFMKNITRAGLKDIIHPVKSKSYEIADWKNPIGLLLIDGLHDYANVSRDFYHFEKWVVPGGYIAFHDYAHYFPGVKIFVNELLSSGKYRKVSSIKTLIIIEKILNTNDNLIKEEVEVEKEIEQQLTTGQLKNRRVTFTCTTGKRLEYFLPSMQNFLNNCKDRKKYITEYIVVDDNSSAEDREVMKKEFPFIRFIWKKPGESGHYQSMNILLAEVKTDYQLQWEDDWLFNRSANYITQAFEIMAAEEQIKQVSFDNRYGGIEKRTPSGLSYTWWDFNPDSCPDMKDDKFEELFTHGRHGYPGWSLNPGLNDFKALREHIGEFKTFKKRGAFEVNYAKRFYLAGFRRASLVQNSVDHIGKISAYTLQGKMQKQKLKGMRE